jgi:hypothetical protein
MPRITPELMLAFQDELDKLAAIPGLQAARGFLGRQGAAIGTGAGVGALAGGVGGFGAGAVQGYRQAKEQGGGTLGALWGGAKRGLETGMSGAAVGGLAGLGAGAVSGGVGRGVAQSLTGARGPLGMASRTGQRQLHALTGWTPEAGLESIRGGAWGAKDRAAKALQKWEQSSHAVTDAQKAHDLLGLKPGSPASPGLAKAFKEQRLARDEYARAMQSKAAIEKSVGHGMTSLPGMYEALKGPNRLEALKAGVGAGWHGETTKMKALNVAAPLAFGGMAVAASPEEQRGQTLGREALTTGASMLTPITVMPTLGGQVLLRGARATGNTLGKGIDKLRGLRNRNAGLPNVEMPPGVAGGEMGSAPVERMYSNSALGRPPEGMGV